MRPIHLSLAGLHSFREKQEVDFGALCAGGVFGIFGPTGSGKSSILDAITLALYGKVERATNNVQGIMNHAQDQLTVSFTFELGKKEKLRRYRIQRAYKRTGDITMRTSTCRLMELSADAEEIVLADKERDVTQTIQELLGLTIDDFTRAVVLPQGKFAEFLSLKGAERRQMLQRLFHLEQYGDRLNNNLKQRMDMVKSELDKITAEQQGLGDASQESLAALKIQLQETEKQVQERKTQLQQMEKAYEENKQVWVWQEEKQRVEDKLIVLGKQEEEILQLEKKLGLAQQAEQVKPYAEELQSAVEAHKHWQDKEAFFQKEVKESKEYYQQSVRAYEVAQNRRIEEEPKLLVRQEQLKQAQILEEDRKQLEKQVDSMKVSLQQIEGEKKEKEEALIKEQALQEKALVRQKELKKLLEEQQVSSELRVNIRRANEERKEIRYNEQKLSELSKETEKQLLLLKQEQNKREQIGSQAAQVEGRLSAHFSKTERVYNYISELDKQLESIGIQITREMKEQKEAYDQERQLHLAHQLAHALQEGQSCPVCGSVEHPEPNHGVADTKYTERTKRIKQLEDALQQGKDTQNELKRYKYQLEQITEAIYEVSPTRVSQKDSSSSPVTQTIPLSLEQKKSDQKAQVERAQKLEALLHQHVVTCRTYKQELLELEEMSKRDIKSWREYQAQLAQYGAAIHSKEQELRELEQKWKELSENVNAQKEKWKEAYPSFSYENMEEEQTNLDQRDQQAVDISKRLETSVTYIEEREKEIRHLQEKLNQLHVQWVEQETKNNEQTVNLLQKKERLKEYVDMEGNTNLKELVESVSRMLLELKTTEKTTYDAFQQRQLELQMKEKEYSVAVESLKQTTVRHQRALDKWKEQIIESLFTDIEDVQRALVSKEEQIFIKETITNYRDQEKQCLQDHRKLVQQLQGKMLILEEWQEVQEQLEQAKSSRDKALQANAKAVRDLEEMQGKHSRFKELEEMRQELEKMGQQLAKLHSVFRGNSFVEFVATEQLIEVSRDASYRLGQLTRQRYALEVDSNLGFVIRDDANGGVKRPVTSLSGGETFLTSLALALALSAQIQLRGEYPLEFFFLDEGFGTLDQELLDTVITALEKLHTDHLSVGVISHVPELRARLPRQLIVQPESSGAGSTVRIEP